jgi:hypothetical protein
VCLGVNSRSKSFILLALRGRFTPSHTTAACNRRAVCNTGKSLGQRSFHPFLHPTTLFSFRLGQGPVGEIYGQLTELGLSDDVREVREILYTQPHYLVLAVPVWPKEQSPEEVRPSVMSSANYCSAAV